MTRVHQRHAKPGASGAVGAVHHKRTESKKRSSYKVVLEEVTGKKKLKTLLSFKTQAPPGYMFIPAGDPQITSRCKKIAKDEQLTVFIVSTSKNTQDKMSQEVHRIGYHFPSTVVDQACMTLGVTLTSSGRVLQSRFAFIDDQGTGKQSLGRGKVRKKLKGKKRNTSPTFDMTLSQAIIDTQAREAIQDLFPKIPPQDLHEIIGRAFQKGKGLVGTVGELSLVRRAQLAVTAHIRHVYTNYDQLLKMMEWTDARKRVQQACLDMLVLWRGDDDDDGEMEDILREVIVISDNEEDDDDDAHRNTKSTGRPRQRSLSVEILSADDVKMQSVNYANARREVGQDRSISPDTDDVDAVQYLGAAPLLHHRRSQYDQHRLERMGAHRHKIWEEAIDRRRNNPQVIVTNERSNFPTSQTHRRGSRPVFEGLQEARSQTLKTREEGQSMHQYSRRAPIQGSEGQSSREIGSHGWERPMYTEEDSESRQVSSRRHRMVPSSMIEDSVPQHTQNNHHSTHTALRRTRVEEPIYVSRQDDLHYQTNATSQSECSGYLSGRRSDIVLPSIEDSVPSANPQQIHHLDSASGINPFPQQIASTINPQRYRAPSVVYLHELPSQNKKRQMVDREPLQECQQRSALVPVSHGEGYASMDPQPATAVHHDNTSSFALDRRIVQLPPRESKRYENSGERLPVVPSCKEFESQPLRWVPHEPNQVGLVNLGYSVQRQSPKSSVAFQSMHEHQSPIFFNASTRSYYDGFDPDTSSHQVSDMLGGCGQAYLESAVNSERVHRVEQIEREMPREPRDLATDAQQHWYEDYNSNSDTADGPRLYTSSLSLGRTQLPSRARADMNLVSHDKLQQQSVYENQSISRNPLQRPFVQGREYGGGDGRIATSTHYSSQHSECRISNTSCKESFQAPLAESNGNGKPWTAPRSTHLINGQVHDLSRNAPLESENIRPIATVSDNLGPPGKRRAGHVVVLE